MNVEEFIRSRGVDVIELPYTPIEPKWEMTRTVKLIREWENMTGKTYSKVNPYKRITIRAHDFTLIPCTYTSVSRAFKDCQEGQQVYIESVEFRPLRVYQNDGKLFVEGIQIDDYGNELIRR